MVVGLAAVTRPVDGVDHLLPQRNRLHVQVVVAQRVRTEDLRVGDQEPVFGREIGMVRAGVVGAQDEQRELGALVVAVVGGREPCPQELCAARVPAHHVVDLGVRHRHLRSGFGVRARPYRPVDRQAVVDTADALLGAVVCGAHQIDLAELGEDLKQQVVALAVLDLLAEATSRSLAVISSAAKMS